MGVLNWVIVNPKERGENKKKKTFSTLKEKLSLAAAAVAHIILGLFSNKKRHKRIFFSRGEKEQINFGLGPCA